MRTALIVVMLVAPAWVTPATNTHLPGTSAHLMYERAGDTELLLINGNTWLVPMVAGGHRERLDRFAVFVRSLPKPPHVITLQEVWQEKRVADVSGLFPEYAVYTPGPRRRVLGMTFNESGLVTLVRSGLEVTDIDYQLIDDDLLVRYNRRVGKGALALTVHLDGHAYRLVNVHLPNTFRGRHIDATKASFASLELDGVVAGDLNLEPHQLPDGYTVLDTTPTFGNDALGRERVRRIDYIFENATTDVISTVITDPDGRCLPLSDHCFLAARLSPKPAIETIRIAEAR